MKEHARNKQFGFQSATDLADSKRAGQMFSFQAENPPVHAQWMLAFHRAGRINLPQREECRLEFDAFDHGEDQLEDTLADMGALYLSNPSGHY